MGKVAVASHTECSVKPEYVPARHGAHPPVAPAGVEEPRSHAVHDALPGKPLNLPAGQTTQSPPSGPVYLALH